MCGVDMTKSMPGYYNSVFDSDCSLGSRCVKVDDLSRPYDDHQPEIEAIRKAIDRTNRVIVLSTSPGETPLAAADHVATHANMRRISDDFWDSWKLLKPQFERRKNWAPYCGSGHWPDADMLPFGHVRAAQKNSWTRFTHDEQYTVMTLWCMSRSPLMMGGNMPDNDDFTLSLLTNDEVLAVDQHSMGGHQLFRNDDLIAWVADMPQSTDKYLALFNANDPPESHQNGDRPDPAGREIKVELCN